MHSGSNALNVELLKVECTEDRMHNYFIRGSNFFNSHFFSCHLQSPKDSCFFLTKLWNGVRMSYFNRKKNNKRNKRNYMQSSTEQKLHMCCVGQFDDKIYSKMMFITFLNVIQKAIFTKVNSRIFHVKFCGFFSQEETFTQI